jgi:hypothetical protein
VQVTIDLPGVGNVDYSGRQNGRDVEIGVQALRAEIQNGHADIRNINDSIYPALKNYMKDRNIRVLTDRNHDCVIRSTNPESFDQVTSRDGFPGVFLLFFSPADPDALPPEDPDDL